MRLVLVVAVAALLAGPASAANAPIQRHTASDMSFARRALLVKADLGKGWEPVKAVAGRPTLTCAAFHPSMAGIVETGSATAGFRADARVVGQVAWVFGTRAQAATLWRRVVGKGFLKCLVAVGRSAGGLAVTKLQSGELKVPKLAQRTAGYRVVVTAKAKGRTLSLTYDNFLLAQGRTVTQITVGSAQPIPSAVEVALGRAVAKRLGIPGVA